MELTNDFHVDVPVDRAWDALTDVELIAPCLPGAELREVEGEEYRGVVKVKVGPITAEYRGKATFLEKDEPSHRAVLRAEGRESRGQGNASAKITATLVGDGGGTQVSVVTDLAITGRVAQFGRGVLADVSSKLLGQFVDCLETNVLSGTAAGSGPAVGGDSTASSGAGGGPAGRAPTGGGHEPVNAPAAGVGTSTRPSAANAPSAEPVDLLEVAGGSVARRGAPVLAVVGALLLAWVLGRRRRR